VIQLLIRAVVALIVAALLIVQARQAAPRSARRAAFGFGAAAFAAFALGNGLAAAGMGGQAIVAASVAGVALIAISLLMLVRAYRGGEMSEKLRRAREMVAEERARTKERR
jgi:hypothetical protein